ncbi:MAG TPA: hypothetical protein ENH84_06400 [Phycisphaerae bacterium]|nr:hypothetical protein [Phycisphaerae bacterium]
MRTIALIMAGTVFCSFSLAEAKEVSPMQMSLGLYYYTPKVEFIHVVLTGAREDGKSIKLEISKQLGGKVLTSKQIPVSPSADKFTASFPIWEWSEGRYVVSAQLLGADEKVIGSVYRVFFKRDIKPAVGPPTPANPTIRSDGIILLDGKPFFPFFNTETYVYSPYITDCFNIGPDRYGKLGIIANPLDQRKVGLPWVTRENEKTFILLPEEDEMLRKIRKIVEAKKSDPSMFLWFLKHDAKIPMYRGKEQRVRLDNVKELTKIHQFVKKLDPRHLTIIHVEHGQGDRWEWPSDMTPYRNCADIIGVAPMASYERWLIPNFVKAIEEVKGILDPGKPLFIMIGSSIPAAECRTAEDIRCASYLALMHGAAGIVFHMGHYGIDPSYTRHLSVYRGLSREVEELFPIIASQQPTTDTGITVDNKSIDIAVRIHEGTLYVIAVNTSNTLVRATISIADSAMIPKSIKLLFENREIAPKGNGFTDTFTPLEPHVYKLSSGLEKR